MLLSVPAARESKDSEVQFNASAANIRLPMPGVAPCVRLMLPAPLNSEAMRFVEDDISSHIRLMRVMADARTENIPLAQGQAEICRGTDGSRACRTRHSTAQNPEDVRNAEIEKRARLVEELTASHPEVEPIVEWLQLNEGRLGLHAAFFLTRSEIRAILPLGLDGSSFDIYYKSLREGAARIRRTRVLPELRTRRVDPSCVELYVGGRRGPQRHIEIAASEINDARLGEGPQSKKAIEGAPSPDDDSGQRDQRTKEQLLRQCPEVEPLVVWLADHAASLEAEPRLMTYKELRQLALLGLAPNDDNQLYFQRLGQWVRWMRRRKVFPQLYIRAMSRPHGVSLFVRPSVSVMTAVDPKSSPSGQESM